MVGMGKSGRKRVEGWGWGGGGGGGGGEREMEIAETYKHLCI